MRSWFRNVKFSPHSVCSAGHKDKGAARHQTPARTERKTYHQWPEQTKLIFTEWWSVQQQDDSNEGTISLCVVHCVQVRAEADWNKWWRHLLVPLLGLGTAINIREPHPVWLSAKPSLKPQVWSLNLWPSLTILLSLVRLPGKLQGAAGHPGRPTCVAPLCLLVTSQARPSAAPWQER